MESTSYVLSSWDTAGIGSRRFPCISTCDAGLIKFAWKIGWILDCVGSLSLKLTGDVRSSISNGPYHFCRNFLVRRCLSHGSVIPLVDSQALLPTFRFSSNIRRRVLACIAIHVSMARFFSRISSSSSHIRSMKLFVFSGALSRLANVVRTCPLSLRSFNLSCIFHGALLHVVVVAWQAWYIDLFLFFSPFSRKKKFPLFVRKPVHELMH